MAVWWLGGCRLCSLHSPKLSMSQEAADSLEPLRVPMAPRRHETLFCYVAPAPSGPFSSHWHCRPCTWCTAPWRRSQCPLSCPHPSSHPPRRRRQCLQVLCLSCLPAPHPRTASAPHHPTAASAASTAQAASPQSTASSRLRSVSIVLFCTIS